MEGGGVEKFFFPPNTKEQLDALDEEVRAVEMAQQEMKKTLGINGFPIAAEAIRYGLTEQMSKTIQGFDRPTFARMTDAAVPRTKHGSGDINVRLYFPSSGDQKVPVFVYIHGGGFVAGNLDDFDFLCQTMCCITGCGVVSVMYRRAPEDPFPAGLHDCLCVTEWVAAGNVAEFDTTRIAIGGESCGASLAIGVCLLARHLNIKAQFLGCPMINPKCDTPSYTECGNYFTSCTSDVMHWCWKQYLPQGIEEHKYVVPYEEENLEGMPAALITTAQFDPLCDEGELLATKLKQKGVEVQMTRYGGMEHCFWVHPKYSRTIPALQEIASFIRSHLSLPPVDVSTILPKWGAK